MVHFLSLIRVHVLNAIFTLCMYFIGENTLIMLHYHKIDLIVAHLNAKPLNY